MKLWMGNQQRAPRYFPTDQIFRCHHLAWFKTSSFYSNWIIGTGWPFVASGALNSSNILVKSIFPHFEVVVMSVLVHMHREASLLLVMGSCPTFITLTYVDGSPFLWLGSESRVSKKNWLHSSLWNWWFPLFVRENLLGGSQKNWSTRNPQINNVNWW